ncbi:MAG: serine/threonine protein kinase [Deltaproteobacteria bacterium]|nr:serine/threonine protein kinase [Deltaproteobacteria bacterium]
MTPKRGEGLSEPDSEGDTTQVSLSGVPGDDITKSEIIAAPGYADFELRPGAMLGEYRIEGKAGEGGMGVVYAALHPMIGKRAAIKVLRKELCEDPYTVERFIDEARVVNQIGHPNIVDIFAFGEMPNGRSYFVMEWLKGETLRARIARQPLTLVEVCTILRPLARALQAAHDKGVIHRDLKPDNIFLGEADDDVIPVKLLDFGIAKLARTEPRLERTATGTMVGTPMYIAPEQARGHEIDHRADVYSLGAIAFELLTHRTPFLADNAMEMVAKHLLEAPPTVGSVNPNVPAALDRIVSAMLHKEVSARPTLGALITVLEGVKTSETTSPSLRPLKATLAVSSLPSTPATSTAPASAVTPRVTSKPSEFGDVPTMMTVPRHGRTRWFLAIVLVLLSAAIAFAVTYLARRGDPVGTGSAAGPIVVGTVPEYTPDAALAADVSDAASATVEPVVPSGGSAMAGSAEPILTKGSADPVVTPIKRPPPPPPPTRKARLAITLRGAATAEYFLDGKKVGSGRSLDIQVALGGHELEVRSGAATERLHLEVTKATSRTVTLMPVERHEDNGLMEPGSLPKKPTR